MPQPPIQFGEEDGSASKGHSASSAHGQRNQFILNAICAYGEQTEEERQERFAQRVAEIVMDGLSDASIFTVPGEAANTKEPDADMG